MDDRLNDWSSTVFALFVYSVDGPDSTQHIQTIYIQRYTKIEWWLAITLRPRKKKEKQTVKADLIKSMGQKWKI